ncbi:MAG TPA: aromatic ring-hydroxylating dioxygenase subunit alpha [Gammaproteobacteria bacterium]|nr:aromatic ring-hydroxylating dioxygenase subunit alpha [Gammaproteobacteria bacterium]
MIVSAYGRTGLAPQENAELTHVTLGTPMGELLRRYWQPVCLSSDLDELPKYAKILGEELVAFRDKRGRVGVLDAHCAHRGTSLEYGRVEENGIRCCYHGWLYGADGACLEQPGEPPASTQKERIAQPAYPAHEFGGLVFAYMGPPDRQPVFPRFDILEREGWKLFGYRNTSRGAIADCNWLQIQENAMDPIHTAFLHSTISTRHFTDIYATLPQLDFKETAYGMKYVRTAKLPSGRTFERVQEAYTPNMRSIADNLTPDRPHSERATLIGWWVPVDNTHTMGFHIEAYDPSDQEKVTTFSRAKEGRTAGTQEQHRDYADTQRNPDDKEAQVSQRPIAVHGLEHLGTTDRGVVMFRRMLRRALEEMKAGRDPQNVFRDPQRCLIEVIAGNTVS